MVFDNLTDPEVLTGSWPKGRFGSVIVTTVDRDVTFGLSHHSIPVQTFSEAEGAGLLLSHACIDAPDTTAYDSALKLSRELGGLPLGITSTAAFIRLTKLDIKVCADEFKHALQQARHKQARYDDYAKDLSTVWKTHFAHLAAKPHSIDLLGILSFLGADSVPRALFGYAPSEQDQIPMELSFIDNNIT